MNPGRSNPEYALGTNELPVQLAIERELKVGAVVYDVGANVGFLTVLCAHIVGPSGFVYAFEPNLSNAAIAAHNARRNGLGHVLVTSRAAAARTGVAPLYLAEYSGGHSLVEESDGSNPPPIGTVDVETVTLDDFAAMPGVRPPDLVKIDVEGAELAVIEGMGELLARVRPCLLVELDDAEELGHQRKLDELSSHLHRHGYAMERLPPAYPSIAWVVSHWLCRPRAAEAAEPPAPPAVRR